MSQPSPFTSSLDSFAARVREELPEHAAVTLAVVDAVKAYAEHLPRRTEPFKTTPAPASRPTDRETALASLLMHTVQSTSDGFHDREGAAGLAFQLRMFREDMDVVDAYKSRIVELQKVVNGTLPPGELPPTIEAPRKVAVGIELSTTQQQSEMVHNLSRMVVTLREKLDRSEAEASQWSANVAALLGENAMLSDRVRLLETEVITLGKHNSTLTKELAKTRLGSGGDVTIGDVTIDREVALWIKDVYVGLAEGKDTKEVVQAIRRAGDVESVGRSFPSHQTTARTRHEQTTTSFSTKMASRMN